MNTPRWWHSNNALSALLTPLSWGYALGATLDRIFTRPQRAALPVIALGNITAGGAGKTPAAIAIAQLLQAAGDKPALISRGYKANVTAAKQVHPTDDWRTVGDEPLLLANTAPTFVCPKRLHAANAAANAGATLAIADDGLQHYALAADVNLLVIDGAYGIGNGHLLPAGPLRETLASAQERCHAILLIGEDKHGLNAHIRLPIFPATLEVVGDTSFLQSGKFFAFAGLARPEKFYDTLRQHGAELSATRNFADHHPYSTAELDALLAEADALGATLITTEKDKVKIPAPYHARIRTLPVALRFTEPQKLADFLRHLIFSPTPPK